MASFADVTAAVLEERRYQDYKWGNLNEHPHDLSTWLCLVNKKLRWAVDSFFGHDDGEVVLSTLVNSRPGCSCTRAAWDRYPEAWLLPRSRHAGDMACS